MVDVTVKANGVGKSRIPVEEFFATQYLSKELLEVLHSEVQTRRY